MSLCNIIEIMSNQRDPAHALPILKEFKQALEAYQATESLNNRSTANKLALSVSNILDEYHIHHRVKIVPPPIVGSGTQSVDLISNWDKEYFGESMLPHTLAYLDRGIGAIESGEYLKFQVESKSFEGFFYRLDNFLTRATSIWFLLSAPFRIFGLRKHMHNGMRWAISICCLALVAGGTAFFLFRKSPLFLQWGAIWAAIGGVSALGNMVATQYRKRD